MCSGNGMSIKATVTVYIYQLCGRQNDNDVHRNRKVRTYRRNCNLYIIILSTVNNSCWK